MVETLIYIYLLICVSMIVFNVVTIFVFHHQDKKLSRRSENFKQEIEDQIKHNAPVDEEYLKKKLKKVKYLTAFEKTLDRLFQEDEQQIREYIESIYPVFAYLTFEYLEKNQLQSAYFPFLIKKYGIFKGSGDVTLSTELLKLVHSKNLYCKENALEAIYTIGNADAVLEALEILDRAEQYYHQKMVTDGLLNFSGDFEELADKLWQKFPRFTVNMKTSVLSYFRLHSDTQAANVLRVMNDNQEDREVRFCCIRYFARHKYQPAYQNLLDFTQYTEKDWEYAAISATALATYPGDKTIETLKDLLRNRNWYIRYNAAESLDRLGMDYESLIDIFSGDDRYASEMLQYRFDRRNLSEQEAVTV
ncbi:MAG: HEAT repeat domain-containing protein [Clostridia bacterium]|nr:HEAT repeat domain-containing protein [Clostridia bacterium]